MTDISVKYSYKLVPTLKRFSESNAFVRGLMGPYGSGKSSGCVIEIFKRCCQQAPDAAGTKRSRWAIVRNTMPMLKDTSLKTWNDWFPAPYFGHWKETEHTFFLKFEDVEAEILFRGLDRPDHVKNLLSLELTAAWVNEAREIPWTIIQSLIGRVGRYPKEPKPTWYGMIMDTNPPDTDAWWYRQFEETKPDGWELFRQPSGTSPQAENRIHLPEKYYENLLNGMDEGTAKVYVHGEYGFTREGQPVYPEYVDSVHCSENVQLGQNKTIIRGWDFGIPACVWIQEQVAGQFYILEELCPGYSMGIDQFSDEVIRISNEKFFGMKFEDYGDPAGQARAQTDEKTCFQILQSKHIDIQPGDQTLAMRLESTRKALRTLIHGRPQLMISPDCKLLRKALGGLYRYRRIMTAQEKYATVPEKNIASHLADALSYVMTRKIGATLIAPKSWKAEKLNYKHLDRGIL